MPRLSHCYLLMGLLLFGCSDDSDPSFSDSRVFQSRLDKVLETGVVVIGSGYTVPPLNYIDSAGNHTGFDIDLGRAVVANLSQAYGSPLEVELVKVNSKTRVVLLVAGRLDMTVSSMSQTASREAAIDFAFPPYLWVGKQFYAKKGRFNSIEDLAGKRIAVQQGSNAFTAGAQVLERAGDTEPKILGFATDGEALLALKQDTVDAITQDNVILAAIMGEAADHYESIGPIYSPSLYSIGVSPNDSSWRDAVSAALQQTFKDGTYEAIYQHWFGPEGRFPLATNARPRLPADTYGDNQLMFLPD